MPLYFMIGLVLHRSKVVTGYLLAGLSILALYACGVTLGASLPTGRWLAMTGLLLVGLIPFAALGLALGHLVSSDSIDPAVGGLVGVLALLGGRWFPISGHGFVPRAAVSPGSCRPAA
jgi:ABC-2 type transport system permease protein